MDGELVMPKAQDNYQKFLNTNGGRKLLQKHSLSEEGVWRILGEDPNCDFGGHHYQPELGTVSGKLGDVIAYAVELPRFWQWGGGGTIVKQKEPRRVDSATVRARQADLARIAELEAELKQLKERNGL
jgi:hypothetical protein